jgi:hypothetical protein
MGLVDYLQLNGFLDQGGDVFYVQLHHQVLSMVVYGALAYKQFVCYLLAGEVGCNALQYFFLAS